MKNIIKILFLLVFALLVGCNSKKNQKIENIKKSHLDGTWLLVDVIDSVLKQKKIVENIFGGEVNIEMILIEIHHNKINTFGIFHRMMDTIKNTHKDTLAHIGLNILPQSRKKYVLCFDEKKDIIYTQTKIRKYIYRRITPKDSILYAGDNNDSWLKDLEKFYIKKFIAGTYKAIDNQQNISNFVLHYDGKVEGFKNFYNFEIYIPSGTIWRFNTDAISFESREESSPMPQQLPNESNEIYHRKIIQHLDKTRQSFSFDFKGDTLILNKLEPKLNDFLHYELGVQKYYFLKQKSK
ncbi:MAG: hypothetical protein EAZ85_02225 [Bacteroidetes bacterium]|nr:MAG: hypothetical protein EAZ85_02225 [Bacteroidota bacterium]TAG90640.1 MAG: hypothetical protein EAZ20_03885 [Bacteroidota bacterium]